MGTFPRYCCTLSSFDRYPYLQVLVTIPMIGTTGCRNYICLAETNLYKIARDEHTQNSKMYMVSASQSGSIETHMSCKHDNFIRYCLQHAVAMGIVQLRNHQKHTHCAENPAKIIQFNLKVACTSQHTTYVTFHYVVRIECTRKHTFENCILCCS